MTVTEPVISKVISLSNGDMRAAVTTLQSCYNLTAGGHVKVEDVEEMSGRCPRTAVAPMWDACRGKNFTGMQNAVEVRQIEERSNGWRIAIAIYNLLV